MKKKLNKNHKGLAMAMAVGFAAMAAPMTAQAEELPDTPSQPGETETPVPASTKEGETPVESAPIQETQTPLTNENETPIGSTPVQEIQTPPADDGVTPPTGGEVTPPTSGEVTPPTGSDEGNPSTGSDENPPTDNEENPPVEDDKTPIENPETLDDAKHNVDLAEQDVAAKEKALEDKKQEENELLEEQKDTEDKKDSADSTMTKLEGEVGNAQTAVNDAKNDLKEWEADPDDVTTDLKDAEAGLKTETEKFPLEGDDSTKPTQDAVANAQTDLENARKEAEDAQNAYNHVAGEEGNKDADIAKLEMDKAQKELGDAEKTLAEKQGEVNSALDNLKAEQTELNSSLEKVPESSDSEQNLSDAQKAAMDALRDVKAKLTELLNNQETLNGALKTQAAIEDALKSLTDIETDLDSLNVVQIKDYEDSLKALSEAENALKNAETALNDSNTAFDRAATALLNLSDAQKALKDACDALNNITLEDLENDPDKLDELKANLDKAYADDNTNKENYEKAIHAIADMKTALGTISGLNVPTADLLGDALTDEDKTALLNTLKSAVATNLGSQKADAEAAFEKAQRKIANSANDLITAANEMLKVLTTTEETVTSAKEATKEASTVETTLSGVKISVTNALNELIKIAQTTDGVKPDSETDTEGSPTDITVEKAQYALTQLAAIKDSTGSLKVKTNVTTAKSTLTEEEGKLDISVKQVAVTESRDALTTAMENLSSAKTALDSATPSDSSDGTEDPSTLIENVQEKYDAMVEAETALETAKTALSTAQSKLDEAESNYITKKRAYDKALNELTWLQAELKNANEKVKTANAKRNELLGVDSDEKAEEHTYVQSRNAWRTACANLGTLQQKIIDAKKDLAQKKQDLTVAIAKQKITDKIKYGTLEDDAVNTETENTVNSLINTLGIIPKEQNAFRENFKTHVTNYHTAFTNYNNAVARLGELEREIADATAARKEAEADLKKAQTNLAIAEAVRDSFLTKPVTPSQGGTSGQTVRKPIPLSIEDLIALRAAVYDSQAGDLPSYTDADKTETAENNDTQWTSAEYTYAGFLDECEKGILSISPMKKRTSPNLELSVENTTFTIVTKTWMSFDKKVINALSTRPDLSIDLKFLYKGKWYRALIPAGYNLKSLLNKDGYCGFLYLYKLFGVNGQTAASC